MQQDFSWRHSALEYRKLYEALKAGGVARRA
jgi:glycogen synthase